MPDDELTIAPERDDRLTFSEKDSAIRYPINLDDATFVSAVQDELWFVLFSGTPCHSQEYFLSLWRRFGKQSPVKTAFVDW